MSAASFRERAAIALRTCVIRTEASHYEANDVTIYNEAACSPDEAAREAQVLADACCKAWGHHEWSGHCKRCGAELST